MFLERVVFVKGMLLSELSLIICDEMLLDMSINNIGPLAVLNIFR